MKRPDHRQNESELIQQVRTNNNRDFTTDNPRHFRALHSLLRRPMPREHLDQEIGCSNSPELIAELRRRGLEVPCERVPDIDQDGKPIRRGVYYLTGKDRAKVMRFIRGRKK